MRDDEARARSDALASLEGLEVVKGHGTGNDFVLLPDPTGAIDLTPEQVRALTDRHFGIGADGVLRVVPTIESDDVADQAGVARWFMDYRNADGSVSEMCGNGARVFARFLVDSGIESQREFTIATRGGPVPVRFENDGDISLDMGLASTPTARATPVVQVGPHQWNGSGVLVPNPHCVVFVDDDETLDELDLTQAPVIVPETIFVDGVNVEFAVRVGHPGDRHVRMRVFERGVGETLSCGTGAVAVMVATAARDEAPVETAYDIDVPGGRVRVSRRADQHLELRGPAVLVASIRLGG